MFDVIIEVIRTIITGGILWFLYTKRNQLNTYPGWNCIFVGFCLLLFANFLDITDNVDALSKYVVVGDTPTQAILEKVFGYLASSLFMLVGFVKLIPFLQELHQTKSKLQKNLLALEQNMKERDELNFRLLQAQKMESIGKLTGGVAHDFNNVLSVINGYSELLLMKLNDDSPIKKDIEIINHAGQKATALTRQLLAFSRKQIFEIRPVHVNTLIIDFIKLLQKALGEDINLETHMNATNDVIEVDPGQIEQVLMNLAVNARDAMPHGGVLIVETQNTILDEEYVQIYHDAQPGPYVMIIVTDTGKGMSEDVRKNIFDPFFTTKERDKGTGLGLSTSYGIIKQHNGQINVYSESGKGTSFKIYIPLSNKKVKESAVCKDVILPHGVEVILVVDDEPAIRKLVISTLESFGYNCLDASCASDALKLTETLKHPPQLLLTDVIMPGMNGKELADTFSKKYPATKTIFMSGYTDNTISHHGILENNVNFIQKPVTPRLLLEKVRYVLDRR